MAPRQAAAPPTPTVDAPVNGDGPAPVFTYTPDGATPIDLPLHGFELPSFDTPAGRVWLYDYNELPPHEQIWIWLRRANIARPVAHRVVELPPDMQLDVVSKWLQAKAGVSVPE